MQICLPISCKISIATITLKKKLDARKKLLKTIALWKYKVPFFYMAPNILITKWNYKVKKTTFFSHIGSSSYCAPIKSSWDEFMKSNETYSFTFSSCGRYLYFISIDFFRRDSPGQKPRYFFSDQCVFYVFY